MNCAVSSTGVVTNSFQHLWMKESLPTAVRFHSTALASGDQHFQHGSAANAIAKGWLTSDAPGFQGRSNIYIYEEIYSLGLVPGDTEAKAGQGFFSLLVRVMSERVLAPPADSRTGDGTLGRQPPLPACAWAALLPCPARAWAHTTSRNSHSTETAKRPHRVAWHRRTALAE